MGITVEITVQGDLVVQSPGGGDGGDLNTEILNEINAKLDALGVAMSALSDAVDQVLASEADEDAQAAAALAAKDAIIADLQAQLEAAAALVAEAQANDAADQATIDAQQAELAQNAADVQAQIDRLNEAFPPVAVPPPDEPPPDGPPPDENPPQ